MEQNDESIQTVRQAIRLLSQDHPVQPYLKIAGDLASDSGLVDTFLHGRAKSYDVDGCIDLANSAGLDFQGWLLKAPYYAHDVAVPSAGFYDKVNALPEEKIWSVMERIHTLNARHFFIATRPERPKSSYQIDFDAREPRLRAAVPLQVWLERQRDLPFGLAYAAEPGAAAVRSEHRRSSQHSSDRRGPGAGRRPGARQCGGPEKFGRKLFQSLWRLDFVAIDLSAGS